MRLASQIRDSFDFSSIGWSSSAGSEAAFGKRFPRGVLVAVSIFVLITTALIGLISPSLGFKTPMELLLVIVLFFLVVKRPEWGLVFFLILTSTLFVPEYFGKWSSDNTVYLAYEMVLILLVGRALLVRREPTVTQTITASPAAIALIAFASIVVAKSLVFPIQERFTSHSIFTAFFFDRSLSLYLLFIPVLIFFNSVKRQRWMVRAFLALGAIVSTAAIFTALFPRNSILGPLIASQSLQSDSPTVALLVQRVRPPGGALDLACFWVGLMNLLLRPWNRKRLALYVPLTLVTLAGVLLEFNRSYFIPIAVLAVLVMLLNRKNVRLKLISLFVVVTVAVLLFATATGTLQKYVGAIITRYGSTFSSQTESTQSLSERDIEDNFAWAAIRSSPAFGISLNDLYRPPVVGMSNDLRWYDHDAYAWIWIYFGMIGLAAFIAALAAVLLRGLFNWGKIRDPFLQAALVGMMLALVTLAVADYVNPKFYEYQTVPVIALMMGLIEAIIIRHKQLLSGGQGAERRDD